MDSKTIQINLVDGTFSPIESLYIVKELIQQKINFHKLQRISWKERNVDADVSYPDLRIEQLMEELERVQAFIDSVRNDVAKVRVDGTLTLTTV